MYRKDPKEQMRQHQRALKKTQRDLDRDRNQLERHEKQLESDIKRAAKRGDKQTATVLAKQLVRLRQQKAKSLGFSSQITATGHQMKTMQSSMAMAHAMGQTAKTMGAMNQAVRPQDIQKTMMEFEKQSTHMGMAEEMMSDTMDSILADSDEEDEQDAVISQVLDEIGIEVTSKLSTAQVASHSPGTAEARRTATQDSATADLEARLAQLHSS